MNVAVTDVVDDTVMLQAPVPLHAPDQPAKVEPVLAIAVSVTDVPAVNVPLHVWPQLIPAGVLLTIPEPVPAFVTLIWTLWGLLVCDDPQPGIMSDRARRHVKL